MYMENYAEVISNKSKYVYATEFLTEYFELIDKNTDNFSWDLFYGLMKEKKLPTKEAFVVERTLRNIMSSGYSVRGFERNVAYTLKHFFSNWEISEEELSRWITDEEWTEYIAKIEDFILNNDGNTLIVDSYIFQRLSWLGLSSGDMKKIHTDEFRKIEGGVEFRGISLKSRFFNERADYLVEFLSTKNRFYRIITETQERELEQAGVSRKILKCTGSDLIMSGKICQFIYGLDVDLDAFNTYYMRKYIENFK